MKSFRSTYRVVLLILLTIFFTACNNGGGKGATGGAGDGGNNTITIKGSFSGGSHAGLFNNFFAWIFTSAYALTPNDVSKVIVFRGDGGYGGYSVSTVTDGSFSIAAEKGSPVGLIFAGANNNYLGYLTLSNGIDSIPLTKVTDGVTTIDLQTISSNGIVASPGHNPIGTELPLSSAEQAAIAQSNGMFASTIRDPDVDGNGVIDMLENKFYRPCITYAVLAGNFGGAYTPTINSTVTMDSFNVSISSQSTSDSGGATVTGPIGSGLTNAACYEFHTSNQIIYSTYQNLATRSPAIPATGEYTFRLNNGKVLAFSVPDQSLASSRIVVAVPTVILSNGTINKISWVYRIPNDSSSTLTATAIIENIMIQINDTAGTRVYDSPWITSTSGATEHLLTNQSISWSNVNSMSMTYNDVYGNHYVVGFSK